jgi:hypothetical protein
VYVACGVVCGARGIGVSSGARGWFWDEGMAMERVGEGELTGGRSQLRCFGDGGAGGNSCKLVVRLGLFFPLPTAASKLSTGRDVVRGLGNAGMQGGALMVLGQLR